MTVSVGSFFTQLRRKIEDDPAQPCYIVTEPGVGYRFCGDAEGNDLERRKILRLSRSFMHRRL